MRTTIAASLQRSYSIRPLLAVLGMLTMTDFATGQCPRVADGFAPREIAGEIHGAAFHTDPGGRALFLGGNLVVAGSRAVHGVIRCDATGSRDIGTYRVESLAALASYNGQLVGVGRFRYSNPSANTSIGAWDGAVWGQIPGAPHFDDPHAVAVDGTRLIVGAAAASSSTVVADGVAVLDGTWMELPVGDLLDDVYAVTSFRGDVIAAGTGYEGSAGQTRVLRWNGAGWEIIGEMSGRSYYGMSIAVHDDRLYFTSGNTVLNGVAVQSLAVWDGQTWADAGVTEPVYSLTVSDGEIYLGQAGRIVRGLGPDAVTFHPPVDLVSAIAVNAGRIVATDANTAALFDGGRWSMLGIGTGGGVQYSPGATYVSSMLVFDDELVIAGRFAHAGGIPAASIASWSGTRWRALGAGLPRGAHQLCEFNGELIAVTSADDYPFAPQLIMRWNGSSWRELPAPGELDEVHIAVFDGELYVCGIMVLTVDGEANTKLARWNGAAWHGAQLPELDGVLNALVPYGDELLVLGRFDSLNNIPHTNGAAKWNGERWAAISENPPFETYRQLYVVGDELFADGVPPGEEYRPTMYLYQSADDTWRSFSGALNAGRILRFANRLVSVGGPLLRWTGSTWLPLVQLTTPSEIFNEAYSFAAAEFQGDLYVGGNFVDADSQPAGHIARFTNPIFPPDVRIDGPSVVCPGNELVLHAVSEGDPPQSYRWHKGFSVLPEDETYSGTRTATLRIQSVLPEDAGTYQCAVTNSCTTLWPARPVRIPSSTISGDANCDGLVNNLDVDAFVLSLIDPEQFGVQFPCCNRLNGDVNHDQRLDMFDIDPFVQCITDNVVGACP